MTSEQILQIAVMCHQTNKSWCEINGDYTQKNWEEAEQWQRDSAIAGVNFRLNEPQAGPAVQHNAWMADKLEDDWVFGEVKNVALKTHPCIVPYTELPEFQKKKDALFIGIVNALL